MHLLLIICFVLYGLSKTSSIPPTTSPTKAPTNIPTASPTYFPCVNNVVINNGVTLIPNYAFYNCIALTSITLPTTVTSIGIIIVIVLYLLLFIKIIDSYNVHYNNGIIKRYLPKSITLLSTS